MSKWHVNRAVLLLMHWTSSLWYLLLYYSIWYYILRALLVFCLYLKMFCAPNKFCMVLAVIMVCGIIYWGTSSYLPLFENVLCTKHVEAVCITAMSKWHLNRAVLCTKQVLYDIYYYSVWYCILRALLIFCLCVKMFYAPDKFSMISVIIVYGIIYLGHF